MQKTQPKLLVVWGKHDLSFDPGEPERYRKDVPNAEVHVLEAGHFALDTKADEIAALVRGFMQRQNRLEGGRMPHLRCSSSSTVSQTFRAGLS